MDVSHLSPDAKRELLKRLMAERAATGTGDYALSQGQRALWFIQQFRPDSYAYSLPFALRMRPRVDLAALQTALDQLVARHACLRTIFPSRDGEPIQRVTPPAPVALTVIDATTWSEEALFERVMADVQAPFRLDEATMSVSLYRRADEDLFLFNVHHIVFDARSLQVYVADLAALYEAAQQGAASTLSTPPARYTDFVTWQTSYLESPAGEALWRYWSAQLTPPAAPLEIASATARPASVRLRGTYIPFSVARDDTAALYAIAHRHQTTLYAVMLAALRVTLQQVSGQRDLVVGTPVSLRSRPEWADIIGYFVNMVAVRGEVPRDGTFADLVTRTRDTVLGALQHQDFPFPTLVDRLKVPRETNRSPVFQVMLNVYVSRAGEPLARLLMADEAPLPFGSSRCTPYPIPQQEGQFELVVEATDAEGMLYGNLKYQTDVYSTETAQQIVEAYQAVLHAVATTADVPLAELETLGRDSFEL